MIARAAQIADLCENHLYGQGQEIQGLVLLELVGRYFGGHRADTRDEAMEIFNKTVKGIADAVGENVWNSDFAKTMQKFGGIK